MLRLTGENCTVLICQTDHFSQVTLCKYDIPHWRLIKQGLSTESLLTNECHWMVKFWPIILKRLHVRENIKQKSATLKNAWQSNNLKLSRQILPNLCLGMCGRVQFGNFFLPLWVTSLKATYSIRRKWCSSVLLDFYIVLLCSIQHQTNASNTWHAFWKRQSGISTSLILLYGK